MMRWRLSGVDGSVIAGVYEKDRLPAGLAGDCSLDIVTMRAYHHRAYWLSATLDEGDRDVDLRAQPDVERRYRRCVRVAERRGRLARVEPRNRLGQPRRTVRRGHARRDGDAR